MIDLTINQPLLSSPSSRRGAIAPGLLRVLQQAVAIRLVLAVLALGVFGAVASGWLPAQQMAWVPVLLVIEAVTYLGFVTWSRVRDVLGRWFLPAALGWFLLAPIVEQALRASPLEDLGLSEALRQLCRRQAERMDIPMDCDIAAVEALDPLTEQALYRVAEAALANVERHAAATQVRVSLARSLPSGRLRLEIRDNGTGFDPADVQVDRFGLTGMAEWAELAGADLQIETASGQGTLVALEIRE